MGHVSQLYQLRKGNIQVTANCKVTDQLCSWDLRPGLAMALKDSSMALRLRKH